MTERSECTATTCPYCGVGCGILARSAPSDSVGSPQISVKGDEQHPANYGRLCIKGSTLHETMGREGRLLEPEVEGLAVDWDQALDEVAQRLKGVRNRYGPESIGFYLSGQLLTEDYYVANKLAKGFIGTPHVDTNSRLCMSSAVASHKRAFGADMVPGCYEDLELADLVVLVGSNTAWNHPVLYQRIKAAGEARADRKIVVVDPRRTATCEMADLHLQLRPGTDAILFNGLLRWIAEHDGLAGAWIAQNSEGLEMALAAADSCSPAVVARQCDLNLADLHAFYRLFLKTERTVTLYSQGINQSTRGTDQGNAIINCHLATGRVGLPGASPFSITGQPNAMGGREVGGLANQLAAHTDYGTPGARECVQAFWNSPAMPERSGYKAVEMFEAVGRGEIKALWIMATNPAVSLPKGGAVAAALAKCPLVIVSDCVNATDTLEYAHIKLPAQGWSEKDGTVTNSERRISRQRALLPPPGLARPDWWIISQVATRMGYEAAFAYTRPAQIFREHAALSAKTRELGAAFDISGLARLSDSEYDELSPIQWPVNQDYLSGKARLFGDGKFYTPNMRARFVAVSTDFTLDAAFASRPLAQPGSDAAWFMLNTGRLRDQWHTMTRTGRSSRLFQHTDESFLAMCPADAKLLRARQGELVKVSGQGQDLLLRLRLDPSQRQGEVFAPIHWSRQWSGSASVCQVIGSDRDPLSGQPAFKQGRVQVEKASTSFQALLLSRQPPAALGDFDYWSKTPLANTIVWRLASNTEPGDWQTLLGGEPQLQMLDSAAGRQRLARFENQRLAAVLMVERDFDFPSADWIDGLFAKESLTQQERRSLLAGSLAGAVDTGKVVCSCFQVGEKTIASAIRQGLSTVADLKEQLKCGSNCGSCIPELKALLEEASLEKAV